MLQLVHLYFTRPAFRPEAFQRMIDSTVEYLTNLRNSPNGVYQLAFNEVAYDGSPLFRTSTVDEVRAIRIEEVERIYREHFDDPAEWTFLFVGNIDLSAHRELIETYLGGIPAPPHGRDWAPSPAVPPGLNVGFPVGPTSRMVVKGIEDQARTSFMVWAPYGDDDEADFQLDVVADLLDMRLRERLREERGDTYGVGVGASSLDPLLTYGRLSVSFGSAPDRRSSMVSDVIEEIRRTRDELATSEEVTKLREMRYNSLDEASKENGYWLGWLTDAYTKDRDPRRILDARTRIDRIDARGIRSAARRWIDLSRTAEVFLVPESWGPAQWLAPEPVGQ
jgi:zinc protease